MSDTRLQSITTQQLALQNPDGSFPPLGVVLAVTDSVGTIAPVTDISVNSLTADQVSITGSIIQNQLVSQSITSEDITVTSFSGNTLSPYDVSASRLTTTHLYATDANANYTATPSLTADTAYVTRTIAGTANITTVGTGSLSATTVTSGNAIFTDLSATTVTAPNLTTARLIAATDVSSSTATVDTVTSDSFVATSLRAGDISGNTVTAQNATVTTSLSTKNVTVQGAFTFNTISLQNLTSAHVIANDISTNVLTVTDSAILGDVSATTLNIHNLTETGSYTAANVRANTFTPTTLTLPNTLKPTALTVTGTANMADVSANTIISAIPTMTNMTGTRNRTTNAYISSGFNIGGGGALKYTSELLMNDVSASSMYILRPTVPFGAAHADNGLATVGDIRASLTSTVSIFNDFMGKFNDRDIVVDLSPKLVFNSTMSMQFILSGVVTAPVVFAAGAYSLNDVIRALNAVCRPNIVFSTQNTTGNLWQTTITVVNSTNTFIADSSNNTYTSSLQLLRWLGFTIDNVYNPFQSYFNGAITNIPLTAGPYISNLFDGTNTISYPPTSPTFPTYSINSIIPSQFQIVITNYSSTANFTLIQINGTQQFFAGIPQNPIDVTGLLPGTTYLLTVLYADDYNVSSANTTYVTTPVVKLYMASNPPGAFTPTPPTFSTITLTFIDPVGPTPLRALGQYKITATGPNIPPVTYVGDHFFGQIYTVPPTTPYVFTGLVANTKYTFVCTFDGAPLNQYDQTPLVVYTAPLTVPTLTVSPYSYIYSDPSGNQFNYSSNFRYVLSPVAPITNALGYLKYSINGGSTTTYTIQAFDTSYQIPIDLSGTGDISCSLLYTDISYNTGYGPITNYSYNTAFGLSNLPVAPKSLTLNSGSGVGPTHMLGYSFVSFIPNRTTTTGNKLTTNSLWTGYKFNKITFPIPIQASAALSFNAYVYDISYTVYAAMTTAPNILQYVAPPSVGVSNTVNFNLLPYSSTAAIAAASLSTGSNSNVTFNFSPAITTSIDKILMFRITSGTGTITFPSFTSTDTSIPGPYTLGIGASTTIGLRYDYSNNLSNTFALPAHNGVSCQFSYV